MCWYEVAIIEQDVTMKTYNSPRDERIKHGSLPEKEAAAGKQADYQRHCKYISGCNLHDWKLNCSSFNDTNKLSKHDAFSL